MLRSSHRFRFKLKSESEPASNRFTFKLKSDKNDISELQKLLRPLLKNIIVNDYKKDLVGTKEFYIPDDSIFMMKHNDSYKTEYIKFLQFMIQELYKNNLDYSENTGDIITTHSIPSATQEDNKEIDTIKKKYERIYLDNFPHIKAYWAMIGRNTAQLSLNFGTDDLDGTIDDTTKIYSMAGSEEQTPKLTTQELVDLIKIVGRTPVERDTLYNIVKEYSDN